MSTNTKELIQYVTAIAVLIAAFALAIAGFIMPPTGQISDSVLWFFAQCLVFVASIFGISMYISAAMNEIKSKMNMHDEKDR